VTDVLRVEATGETVGEAKWQALRELERMRPDLDKGAVRFQVVSEGERGLLGVGYAPALVVAVIDDSPVAPPEDESDESARVRELVERFAAELDLHCRIEVHEDEETIVATCTGRDLGLLIGKHGQTIDALQYLANAVVHRDPAAPRKTIVVDAAGYRARRQSALDSLAVRSAERALQSGSAVELDPMTAVERKVVHLRLKDFDGVETTSEGTEPNRYVVVHPADGGE
jgi:spoIIIJ-associated protein